MMNITLRVIKPEETYLIRQELLWPEKPIEHVMVKGDKSALHIGIFVEERHIGVISLFKNGERFQFRKLAILPEFQGQGAGKALIAGCIVIVSKLAGVKLWCDARQEALPFYKKLGFQIDSKVFTKSNVFYQVAFIHQPYPNILLKNAVAGIEILVKEAKQFFSINSMVCQCL